MLTLIISDAGGATVLSNVIAVSLDQATGFISYRQSLPHPVEKVTDQGAPYTVTEQVFEIANGDVLVVEAGQLIAHLCTGKEAVRFRPGGKDAEAPADVPTFIGPAEPRGRQPAEETLDQAALRAEQEAASLQ